MGAPPGCRSRSFTRNIDPHAHQTAFPVQFTEREDALGVPEVDHDRRRAEPIRFVTDIENADREPYAPHGLCQIIQVPPDQSAEGKAKQRKQAIS